MQQSKKKWALEKMHGGDYVIYAILFLSALICLVPVWNIICISFSNSAAAMAGQVSLLPVRPTFASYRQLMEDNAFFRAFGISLIRVLLGTSLSMGLMFLMAYPLSKEPSEFAWRNFYMWFIVITMLFSGGLIPTYMVVTKLKLRNTIWALTIPGAVSTYNTILMMNYFRSIPKELSESAAIDGASPMCTLFRIYLPVSIPVTATLTLFCGLYHWNDYFQAMIYIDNITDYPLMSYIRSLSLDMTKLSGLSAEELKRRSEMGSATFNAAKVVVAMIPVMCIYPFVQKYFVKGIMLGSVKG